MIEIEVAGCARGIKHPGIHGGARFACERRVGERFEKFNLLGETEHRPREAACPRAEGRVALLAVGAAIGSVGGIEQRFVRHAPAHIVGIAAGAEIDTELRGGPRVLQQSIQQTDLDVLLLAQSVTELVRQRERAQRPNSVDKQRVRAVERVDIAAALRQARPAAGLHRAADFERQLAEVLAPRVVCDLPLAPEPPQVAVGADVVETVIVHTDMGEMRRHPQQRALLAQIKEVMLTGGIELQERSAVDESFRPLGPAAGGVTALDSEHRRAG